MPRGSEQPLALGAQEPTRTRARPTPA